LINLLMAVAGWMNQQHLELIDYQREQNRALQFFLTGLQTSGTFL